MICGVGSDIIEIDRVKKAAAGEGFLKRVFTDQEISLCRRKPDFFAALAVRFAGKEAVVKALGTGFRGCAWKDVEVVSGEQGQPEVVLYGGALEIARGKGIKKIWISLSHSRGNAVAFCVADGGGDCDVVGDGGRDARA